MKRVTWSKWLAAWRNVNHNAIMPYRRLPNTDQARLRALKTAIQRASESDFTEQILPYRLTTEAENCLLKFENTVAQYKANYESKVDANKKYKLIVQTTRMYISHFIQVLNLSCHQQGESSLRHVPREPAQPIDAPNEYQPSVRRY